MASTTSTRVRAVDLAPAGRPPTPEQQAVIEAPLLPSVVVAGAGSGKTETMAARVVWLVENGLVAPDRVLGLTFTRKAAAELGLRIRTRLAQRTPDAGRLHRDTGGESTLEPTVSTYDAFAARLVADHGLRLGLEPGAGLLRPAAAYQLAEAVLGEWDEGLDDLDSPPAPRTVAIAVRQLHDSLLAHQVLPADFAACSARLLRDLATVTPSKGQSEIAAAIRDLSVRQETRRRLAELVGRYREALDRRGQTDFATMAAAAAALAQLPAVVAAERDRFQVVLLDEFQDTNPVQLALLRGLFGPVVPAAVGVGVDAAPVAVTAVGDPNQAIFAWRGAGADTLGEFRDSFDVGDDRVFPLSVSFRNAPEILAVANATAQPLRAASRRVPVPALLPRPGATPGNPLVSVTGSLYATAPAEARAVAAAAAADFSSGLSVAVLARRRSEIGLLLHELRSTGVPVAVVGLGGLLGVPAVVDVLSTLRVVADADRGDALVRLLAGSRWRIGPRDLEALRGLAADLATATVVTARRRVHRADETPPGIVEALDHLLDRPNRPPSLSEPGWDRLRRLARELQGLRRRQDQPLAELVTDVIRTTGIDVELAVAGSAEVGWSRDLASFVAEADAFAAAPGVVAGRTALVAFLEFLDVAESVERGGAREDDPELDSADTTADPTAVNLLTVHSAKGLEWDSVFVPALVREVFPTRRQGGSWVESLAELPPALRADGAGLPDFHVARGSTSAEVSAELKAYKALLNEAHEEEERRLAYVAVTRARSRLWCSGSLWWPTVKNPRKLSVFLGEVRDAVAAQDVPTARVGTWEESAPDPRETGDPDFEPVSAVWPQDPLSAGRRAAVEAGAALVRAAMDAEDARAEAPEAPAADAEADTHTDADGDSEVAGWERDVAALVAAATRRGAERTLQVALPPDVSVSSLVQLSRDPDGLALRLRRPMPTPPREAASRGTAFHEWLERRWGQQRLLDVDDLPGLTDAAGRPPAVGGTDLAVLQEAFLASVWADRTPTELEYPFVMPIGPVVVHGRIDAVFAGPDGFVDIVDWKTGRPPTAPADARAVAVQLASYRLAWHRLSGVPLEWIRAAFHYVGANITVAPTDLADADDLLALITGSPSHHVVGDPASP